MTRTEFLEGIRKGEKRYRVDNIRILTEKGELSGKGMLEVEDHEFKVHMTLDSTCSQPPLEMGLKHRKDFWLIQGKLEDRIAFNMRSLPSGASRNHTFGEETKYMLEFHANRIELNPIGLDRLTSQELFKLQKGTDGNPIPDLRSTADNHDIKVNFFAVLPDYRLIEYNANTQTTTNNPFLRESSNSKRDTFYGEFNDWEYGFVERDKDLHVYLNSKTEYKSLNEENDWRSFDSLLNTIAFTHGKHAWPFNVEYRRNGKLVTDRVQLNANAAHSHYAPFNHAMGFYNATKQLPWDFAYSLKMVYDFFALNSKLTQEITNILYILREATTPRIPQRISLLTLCSLFESTIRLMYEEKIEPGKKAEIEQFLAVKKTVCEEFLKKGQPAYTRLAAILANSESVNNRMRFDNVIENLGLKPLEKWQELYELWVKYRNPVSHRMSKTNESDETTGKETFAESRLAGALNAMILKLMNYTGPVVLSRFEDKYGQI